MGSQSEHGEEKVSLQENGEGAQANVTDPYGAKSDNSAASHPEELLISSTTSVEYSYTEGMSVYST